MAEKLFPTKVVNIIKVKLKWLIVLHIRNWFFTKEFEIALYENMDTILEETADFIWNSTYSHRQNFFYGPCCKSELHKRPLAFLKRKKFRNLLFIPWLRYLYLILLYREYTKYPKQTPFWNLEISMSHYLFYFGHQVFSHIVHNE